MTADSYISVQGLGRIQSNIIKTPHGMFTRHGGISASPFSTLNLSFHVGDNPDHVTANRRRVKSSLDVQWLASSKQTHSNQICHVVEVTKDVELDGYDALMTNTPSVGLLIQQADCQAVLLHDPVRQAIAAIHCGWRGSRTNIIGLVVDKMRKIFVTDPADLHGVISPSLGPCCAEFINFKKELPAYFHPYQKSPNHFDFWAISRDQLHQAGIPSKQINITGICSVCDDAFFSYRQACKTGNSTIGRNGSIIALRK